jgi:hypothetical protein
METKTINVNEVKKELMKSRVNAKFSHYVFGNLYYTVELADGVYQFPMPTIEKGDLTEIYGPCRVKDLDNEGYIDFNEIYTSEEVKKYYERKKKLEELDSMLIDDKPLEIEFEKLSSDLGTTSFFNEMRGSELNRWIAKAIDKDTFIKIS